jgi:5-formyltetrahydrofolate cyclo-ligase
VKHRKQILRERLVTLLRNQKEEERLTKSLIIQDKLFKMREFEQASLILFYASFDGEVETFSMMKKVFQMGKKIGLPRVFQQQRTLIPTLLENLEGRLEPGPYGIVQPKAPGSSPLTFDEIDMVIVPALAFDKENHRLGRGAGYYDRFLEKLPSSVPTVGLAFDFQIVEQLPRQDHDVAVTHVLVN